MMADVVAGVALDLVARAVPVEVLDGKEHVARDGEGNRIVFVESTDTYGAPQTSGRNPRAVSLRAAGAEVHIWGVADGGQSATPPQHRATTNALLHQFLLALHKTAGAASLGYELQGGQWNNDAEITYGAEYLLNVVVKVPVLDVPWTTVTGVEARSVDRIRIGGVLYVACGE